MARVGKLKVFRTPIGFHDAYVAAPSQKAALEAWGADSNLFASGSAERVVDPELMREPLANPGRVIRRLRGTLAEHVAALPRKQAAKSDIATAAPTRSPRRAKPKPRPSRTNLDSAEAALADLDQKHAEAEADIARRQAELDKARQALAAKQAREREKLADRVSSARENYEQAMREWRAE